MKEKIVVIGGGGHAKVIISILKKIERFEIVGFTDPEEAGPVLGAEYLGTDEILQELYANGVKNAVIGLGQIKSSVVRRKLVKMIQEIGFDSPAIISPRAIINEEVSIGEGTVVMDGAVINSGTIIGDYSIINTNCSVDHDCNIGSFTHIAPGVTLSGYINVGENVLLGTGASVIHDISITSGALIAAGSSVQKNIKIPGLYRGVPARLIKSF